jgi:predicted nucleotidyltransferase
VDLSDPIGAVIPSAHGPVLEVLARTNQPLSGRAVAALTDGKVSHARARQVLADLVAAGLVLAQDAPPARLYRLNRQHLAAEAVTALATLRSTLLSRMRGLAQAWTPPAQAVWLFGSFARGVSDARSDIDVLVVRPDTIDAEEPAWAQQLTDFADTLFAWTGNSCEIVEYALVDLADTLGARLAADLRDHGLVLVGDSPSTLLRRSRARL